MREREGEREGEGEREDIREYQAFDRKIWAAAAVNSFIFSSA